MATVKQAIGEIDVVSFVDDVDKAAGVGTWPAGTVGAVVSDYGDVKMVEITNDRGEALDFPLVPVEQLKLVVKHS
jgi:hypothetical protein